MRPTLAATRADSLHAPVDPVAERDCQACSEAARLTRTGSFSTAWHNGRSRVGTDATVALESNAVAQLLGRTPAIAYSAAAQNLIGGQKVLVTGAGGSIGSEIVRQLITLDPEAVYLLDHDESALHSLELELYGHGLLSDRETVLADIRDAVAIQRVLDEIAPDMVFHAAAHKHLPLLERFPAEAIKANVLGTRNVVSAAVTAGAHCIVNISTDKAAQPTSVLGACGCLKVSYPMRPAYIRGWLRQVGHVG